MEKQQTTLSASDKMRQDLSLKKAVRKLWLLPKDFQKNVAVHK